MLIKVLTTHYGPKDSHTAIEGVWRVESEAQLLERLDGELWYSDDDDNSDRWTKPDEDGLGGLSIATTDKNLAAVLKRAKAMKLKINKPKTTWDDYHIFGALPQLMQVYRGNGFMEMSDLYYGATQFEWEIIEGDVDDVTLTALLGDRFHK